MQNMMRKGIGNLLNGGGLGGGSDASEGIRSVLSNLGGLNRVHGLVQHIQHNCGIQDQEVARQYTQYGVNILNE
jgi:hypothetical protein